MVHQLLRFVTVSLCAIISSFAHSIYLIPVVLFTPCFRYYLCYAIILSRLLIKCILIWYFLVNVVRREVRITFSFHWQLAYRENAVRHIG